MRKVKGNALIILLFMLAWLAGCSPDNGNQNETTQEPPAQPTGTEQNGTPGSDTLAVNQPVKTGREQKVEALKAMVPQAGAKLPETAEEFASFPLGRFAGLTYEEHKEEIEKALAEFPTVDDPDAEINKTYMLALLGLFAEDYPDPQQMIDQIRMASFGNPEIGDPRFQFKENYNVEILLDASGSMSAKEGGKTRMEAAKEAIQAFAESLPKEANVSLRVYGHKGSGKDSDKELSCKSSDLVYTLQPYDASKMQSALNQFKPAGWTPIALALQQAQQDLSSFKGEKNTNLIYLVSDGIETCGGDPVEVAKQLAGSDITPIVNVIGLGVDGEGQQQLKAVAQATGGQFKLIHNQKELQEEFKRAREIAYRWWEWKSGAAFDATMTQKSRIQDILSFHFDWTMAARQEKYNLFFAIRDLKNRGIISAETAGALEKEQETHYETASKRAEELEELLRSLNDKTYKETIDAINKQYSQNAKK